MKIQIIADSCCDITPTMRSTIGLKNAPLKITVAGSKEYIDDENINVKQLLADMKASKLPVSTSAPSPGDYAKYMYEADQSMVVTLSRHLSGSYNSAVAARDMVLEEFPDKKITIFDSKTASAGELRIVLKISELISQGKTFEEIEQEMPAFIDRMRTLFVLEDLSNLIKNGRIPKMAGLLGTVLMLRPIMGENGEGEIIPIEKIRGTGKALERLVEIIGEKTQQAIAGSLTMTLSYCNCHDRAVALKKNILANCKAIGEIIMTPTGGLSTSYTNDGGVVVAFA